MSIQNATIKTGGTISVAGGSDVTFTSRKVSSNMIESQVVADAYKTRRYFKATSNPAKPLATAPNGYTLVRNKLTFIQPFVLANGNVQNNQCSIELAFDVEATAAQKQELLDFAAQAAFDSDFLSLMKDSALT